jgi:hypothetical protein
MPDSPKLGNLPTRLDTQAAKEATPASPPTELDPEDFYYEGPYLVFTVAHHLKRGYCCNSNCRHCPYR